MRASKDDAPQCLGGLPSRALRDHFRVTE